jgi:hypothetical protein
MREHIGVKFHIKEIGADIFYKPSIIYLVFFTNTISFSEFFRTICEFLNIKFFF